MYISSSIAVLSASAAFAAAAASVDLLERATTTNDAAFKAKRKKYWVSC